MKYLFLFGFLVTMIGCSNNPTTYTTHELVVNPKALTFSHADTAKILSITHTCTCPFSWNVNVLTATSVLQNTSGSGDNTQVSIKIDRAKLTIDTLNAALQITSNGYGTDTVQVTIIR